MTKQSHTPGPWEIASQDMMDFRPIKIVHCDSHTPGAASGVIARVTYRSTWYVEQIHNARLIAAAPELLEALREVLGRIDEAHPDFVPGSYLEGVIRRVVAKATGDA